MLRDRIAIVLLLIPFAFWVIADGGWVFTLTIAVILALAAAEYARMFHKEDQRPAGALIIAAVLAIAAMRTVYQLQHAPLIIVGVCFAAMTWHVIDFERGAAKSGLDFGLTLAGSLYIGWLGSYLISVRSLPDGVWWFLVMLPSIWIADSLAYLVGSAIGRHRLAPRLSPKKSWEGYLAGIAGGAAGGLGFALLGQIASAPGSGLVAANGAIVGAAIGLLAPVGDLGISMFKRQYHMKDTGSLLPGHGGALDRIDSWLWAAPIGYYLITWLTR